MCICRQYAVCARFLVRLNRWNRNFPDDNEIQKLCLLLLLLLHYDVSSNINIASHCTWWCGDEMMKNYYFVDYCEKEKKKRRKEVLASSRTVASSSGDFYLPPSSSSIHFPIRTLILYYSRLASYMTTCPFQRCSH